MKHCASRVIVASWALLFLAVFPTTAGKVYSQAAPDAKYIILMIADGWGEKQIEATNKYTGTPPSYQQTGAGWSKHWISTFPSGGSYDSTQAWSNFTYVLQNPTDSAAAATALYTGSKTQNARISASANGTNRLFSIGEQAKALGKSVGAVSSVPLSHATPGAWTSHNRDRNNGYAIADEAFFENPNTTGQPSEPFYAGGLGSTVPSVDVLIGDRRINYVNDDIRNTLVSDGVYEVVEGVSGQDGGANLLAAANDPNVSQLAGLFDHVFHNADGSGFDSETPTLADSTDAALTVLSRNPDGFVLMVEGGAVDWAGHSNNMNQMIGEMKDFNGAVQAVIDWVNDPSNDATWDNTLVIVTGDHECGYLTQAPGVFPNQPLGQVNATTVALEKVYSGSSGRKASWVDADGDGVIDPGETVHWAWNSSDHSNSLIPLFARGAGAELFAGLATGNDTMRGAYLDNTDVFSVMDTVAGGGGGGPSGGVNITGVTVASGRAYVVVPDLQVGKTVYIDRTNTFASVPPLVQGETYIRTANDDKTATNATFLSFTVDQPVTVYVAHDPRITTKPAWLSTFTDTGQNLGISSHANPFRLFARDFPAGLVTLGGNAGIALSSMYSVIVKPQGGPPTAGITVNPTSGLTTTEAGGTATFTVALSSLPTANVTISLSSSDTTEGTVSPSSLTFTPTNGTTPQTVTVTGVDDTLVDGDVAYTIVTGAAASSDPAYNNLNAADVSVTNADNEVPPGGVNITGVTVASGRAYVVVPDLQVGKTVYIDRTNTFASVPPLVQGETYIRTANDDKTATNATFLSFTVDQPVTVYVAHDPRITTKPAWLSTFTDTGQNLGISSHANPFRLFARDFPAGLVTLGGNAGIALSSMYSVIVKPQGGPPTAGITVNPTSGLTTTEAGGTATFTVALSSLPTANVTISLSSSDTTEGTVSPSSLTFTPTNGTTPQTVTVTGVDDTLVDGDVAYTIVTGAAASSDPAYNNLNAADVSVTNADNEVPPGGVNITGVTVASGRAYVVVPDLQVGKTVFIDRAFTFASVPLLVQGETYIRTANDDKTATNATFLSFTVDQPVTVYVAHDSRITTKPAWLSTFTDTGQDLGLSSHANPFRLFARDFPAGLVTLGGNAGIASSSSMYSVIVKPQ